jgi:hypothetical protein
VQETLYTGQDAEEFEKNIERDEAGNVVTKMTPYRQNGRLYTE